MRLVLCDGNRILCEALAAALTAAGHEVAAVAATASEGLEAVSGHMPDACLLGLDFPDEDGFAAAGAIRQHCPQVALLLMAGLPSPAMIAEAKLLGAAGFLSKDQNIEQITRALAAVAAGGTAFGTARPRSLAAAVPRVPQLLGELTTREQEVLRRIVAGQGTRQMACEMNIAISTLRTYVKNLLTKLGTHSRLQAAALASREGLLPELSA
jgi:DNA-binding NarL/FixJ family response regulator